MVVAIVLAVALASLAIMAILAVALLRHLKVLARSLKQFNEEAHPILEEIQRSAAAAANRGAELKGSGDRLRR